MTHNFNEFQASQKILNFAAAHGDEYTKLCTQAVPGFHYSVDGALAAIPPYIEKHNIIDPETLHKGLSQKLDGQKINQLADYTQLAANKLALHHAYEGQCKNNPAEAAEIRQGKLSHFAELHNQHNKTHAAEAKAVAKQSIRDIASQPEHGSHTQRIQQRAAHNQNNIRVR